jgi:hypothetical protein
MENKITNRLKRLRNRYKLNIINEDTFEEVVSFKLTRVSVYIAMSITFILLVSLTIMLIIFTPLKYYLPGVGGGSLKQLKEYKTLKIRTDSMENALRQQQQYLDNIEKVMNNNTPRLDTTVLNLPKKDTAALPKTKTKRSGKKR